MWKPIKIKPNDQSLVGRIIRKDEPEAWLWRINCVGDNEIFVRVADFRESYEDLFPIHDGTRWLIEEPDSPKKLVAPALYLREEGFSGRKVYLISSVLYSSVLEAKDHLVHEFISWPAKINPDGFYEVPG